MKVDNSEGTFDYDSIPIGYYDEVFERSRGIQSKWHHQKFDRVRAELPASGHLVDIGCGPGTFLSTVPASFYCLGLDIAQAQIAYAQARYGKHDRQFVTMTPGRLPLADTSVDVVTVIELIEHITAAEAKELL